MTAERLHGSAVPAFAVGLLDRSDSRQRDRTPAVVPVRAYAPPSRGRPSPSSPFTRLYPIGLGGQRGTLIGRGPIAGGGLILAVEGGTIAEVSTALRELLIRHVDAGAIPGGVALLGAGNDEVVTAGVASIIAESYGQGCDHADPVHDQGDYVGRRAASCGGRAPRARPGSLADWLPELADRQVLRAVRRAELDDTVRARRAITLRHLLTNASGYGMVIQASPLQQAMAANGTSTASSGATGDGR